MSSTYILGAGFSKAISDKMPLLTELGPLIIPSLEEGYEIPLNWLRDFESWLTYLSEGQPWMTEDVVLRNRGLFSKLSRELCSLVSKCETEVRQDPIPAWLKSVVARWHEDRSNVITFNYDSLVEAAFTECVRVCNPNNDKDSQNYASDSHILEAALTPVAARLGNALGAGRIDTFHLLKLHGSIDWYYSGRPEFYGETIYKVSNTRGWKPGDEMASRARLYADKVPLVVPPTAFKSTFFNNETVRAQWRLAFEALKDAEQVYLIGYSIPSSDLLVRFLLHAGCAEGKVLTVVNPQPEIADRVAELLPTCVVNHVGGENCSEVFAESLLPTVTEPVTYLIK